MRSGRRWVLVVAAMAVPPAFAFGGAIGVAIVAGLTVQGLVAARRWPEVGRGARAFVLRVLPSLVGWAVLVVAVDAGVGWVIDEARGDHEDRPAAPLDLAGVELPPADDPRVAAPAYAGETWVERYFAELEALDYGYVPFLGPRVEPVRGRYISSQDGIRRSYEPEGVEGADAVEVWFFGGSTTWGEGQRDLHTIPSEVARLAEQDGVVLRVRNFGERGYTAYRELLLFEQEVAERGAPDLAVFYDGQNEVGSQQETPANLSVQPTVYQLETILDGMARAPALPGEGDAPEPSLSTEYEQTSALHKLLRQLGLVEPVAAQEVVDLGEAHENALQIYRRSMAMIQDVGRRTGTEIVPVWQPGLRDNTSYLALADRLPDGVIDLTDAFSSVPSDDEIFIDTGHTNELGARLAAEAIWEHLAPVVSR